MKRELVIAVLERGGHRCAWCSCKLNTGAVASTGVVCKLDESEDDSAMVASCASCNGVFMEWRRWSRYSHEAASRCLARAPGTLSSPFEDFLEHITDDPFALGAALGRIEDERNAPLDVRKVRAA